MSLPNRALIFDVDGTLVDSNDAQAAAWAEALRDFEIDREVDAIVPLVALPPDKLLPRLAGVTPDSQLGRRISERRRELFRTVYLDHVTAFPGVRELFERLRDDGVLRAVASAARCDDVEALLDIANVRELVDHRACLEDISWPRLDVLDAAFSRLGTDAPATLLVGDSPFDIEAAHTVGIGTIALRTGGWEDRDLDEALAIFDDPRAMLAAYEAHEWDWPAPRPPKPGARLPAGHSLR
ncbi:MAG TPA: HAD family hydrolase [Polyangia bacterium]|nr:HAD family hydrolase [Polyangia bacterium]